MTLGFLMIGWLVLGFVIGVLRAYRDARQREQTFAAARAVLTGAPPESLLYGIAAALVFVGTLIF